MSLLRCSRYSMTGVMNVNVEIDRLRRLREDRTTFTGCLVYAYKTIPNQLGVTFEVWWVPARPKHVFRW